MVGPKVAGRGGSGKSFDEYIKRPADEYTKMVAKEIGRLIKRWEPNAYNIDTRGNWLSFEVKGSKAEANGQLFHLSWWFYTRTQWSRKCGTFHAQLDLVRPSKGWGLSKDENIWRKENIEWDQTASYKDVANDIYGSIPSKAIPKGRAAVRKKAKRKPKPKRQLIRHGTLKGLYYTPSKR